MGLPSGLPPKPFTFHEPWDGIFEHPARCAPVIPDVRTIEFEPYTQATRDGPDARQGHLAGGVLAKKPEAFNGRLRDECLSVQKFLSRADAQAIIEVWRIDDNQRRPHRSLGHLTPNKFVAQCQGIRAAEEGSVLGKNCLVPGPTSVPERSRLDRLRFGGAYGCMPSPARVC